MNQKSLLNLLFRRQFLLGPEAIIPNKYWTCISLSKGLNLSIHNDLPFESISHGNTTMTLLGQLIDPFDPLKSENDILRMLINNTSDLKALFELTSPFVGRWIIIYQNDKGTFLFTDPLGFRQVFYYSDGKQIWCASQPELIKFAHQMSINTDEDLFEFLLFPKYTRYESMWVGPKTLYENCYHLMPNHYLNLDSIKQTRFYPSFPIKSDDLSKVVEKACTILKGSITALAARYEITIALTAGWDSRVLLAASKEVSSQIDYFVYQQSSFSNDHPDIWVPQKIADRFKLKFRVKRPSDKLPGWFVNILAQNVTCGRVLPKTHNIYDKLISGDDKVNINGNGSEICRNYYDVYCKGDIESLSSLDVAKILFHSEEIPEFAAKELDEWYSGFDGKLGENLSLLDMLHWEQRLGNWGAQYPAEQDIAVEEISPFNCRLLIETLSSCPRNLRAEPDFKLYEEMIKLMWPELLSIPINPKPKENIFRVLKKQTRRFIPNFIVRSIKKVL